MAQLGVKRKQLPNHGVVEIPIYEPGDVDIPVRRIALPDGTVGVLPVYPPEDAAYPERRLYHPNHGVLAYHDRARLKTPLASWPDEQPWDKDTGNWRSDSGTMVKRIVEGAGHDGGWAFEMDLEYTSAFWTFPAYSLNPLPEVGDRFGVWWRHMNWSMDRPFWMYVCQQNETQSDPVTYRLEHRPASDEGADMVLRRSDTFEVLDTVLDIPNTDGKWYRTEVEFESDGPRVWTGDETTLFGEMNASESNPLPPNGIGFRGTPDCHFFIDVPEKYPPDTEFTWD